MGENRISMDQGMAAFVAARTMAPNRVRVHVAYAAALAGQGRLELAADAARLANELGASEWSDLFNIGSILCHADRHGEALPALRQAANLMPQSADAMRLLGEALAQQGHFAEAADAFARLSHLVPEDWTAHLNLAVAMRQTSRRVESFAPIARVVQLKPERADLQHAMAMALIQIGRPAEAAPYYIRAAGALREVLNRKAAFYSLRSIFDGIWNAHGPEAAYGSAIELLRQVDADVWSERLGPQLSSTWTFLAEISQLPPRTPFDLGIEQLLARRPVEALQTYARHLSAGIPLPNKYETVLENGPNLAHPAWHLMNPYFYLWSDSALQDGVEVQDSWRTKQIFNAPKQKSQLLSGYDDWIKSPDPARDELCRCIAELGASTRRAIDIGCGIGLVLRLLPTECAIPVDGVFGCDLHEERVRAARHNLAFAAEQMGRTAEEADTLARQNVLVCDALSWDVESFVARHGTFDLVTLFVITGCFDDEQLDRFLSRVARLGARRIFETSVVDRWELWVGRKDASAHFLRHGYRCIRRRMAGESLDINARHLVVPRKYWPGRQICVYERI